MENTAISTQALPAGTRLEEFVIERVLGSGGFGITYLALDTSLGRQVVIKENLPVQFCFRDTHSLTVAPRHTTGEDVENFQWSLENFSKEAAILASLDHPGIVRVLRSFQAFGTAYFVMPFVEGISLDDFLSERRDAGQTFSQDELTGLLERMLHALAYLHDRSIYHRDLKPGNILITNEGVPVLIDFGSARQRLSERSMTVIESPGYTPFEQLQSRGNVGPWSDLYALGVTLAKAITSETPPKANDRVFNDPWLPLAERIELHAILSTGFLAGIDRSMAVRIEERWKDAVEWLVALHGKDAAEIPLQKPQRIEKPSTRLKPLESKVSPLPWIIAACVILILASWAMIASNRKPPGGTITEVDDAAEKHERDEAEAAAQSRDAEQRAVRAEQRAAQAEDEKNTLVAQAKAKEVEAEQQRLLEAKRAAEQQRTVDRAKAETAKADAARQVAPPLIKGPVTVYIGSPGNKPDSTGYGAVPYEYRIGKFEVTNEEYCEFLNGVAKTDTHELYDSRMAEQYGGIIRSGEEGRYNYTVKNSMGKKPVTYVNWLCCARFANWVSNGQGNGDTETGIYTIKDEQAIPPNHATLANGKTVKWAIASENEWYKAAYFDVGKPGGPGYWTFACKGGRTPNCNINTDAPSDVGFYNSSPSPNGTFDQSGNVWEYNETVMGDKVGLRGGSFYINDNDSYLLSSTCYYVYSAKWPNYGFRVVALGSSNPETLHLSSDLAPEEKFKSIKATKFNPFVNSLGMKFVPVEITTAPSAGQQVLFSIWETRVQDFQKYEAAKGRVDGKWKSPGFNQGEDHPVVNVSWEDAVAFCEWLTQHERSERKIPATAKYRLPTDHEWSCAVGIGDREDAARSPASKDGKIPNVYPWGTQWPPDKQMVNYGGTGTSSVGSFPSNESRIHDMGGNVWEWCEDKYQPSESSRSLRGASWNTIDYQYGLSSCRRSLSPDVRYASNGFRCALVVSAR